jgi:hypothetical protein
MNNIAFDVDDVVFNLDEILQQELRKEFGGEKTVRTDYYVNIPSIKTEEQMRDHINSVILPRITPTLEPYPLVSEALTAFWKLNKDNQSPIRFITARPQSNKPFLTPLFEKHFGKLFKFEICFAGSSEFKHLYLDYYDYFVDDRHDTLLNLEPILKKSFLMTRDWNMKYTVRENPKNCVRVKNLMEVFIHYVASEYSEYESEDGLCLIA